MKIIDIQRFINKFKLISEAVTLPQIRRGIIGKDHEYPVIDAEKEWYENHKEEILSTIEKALNVDDKTLKIKLQKFDTDNFFTNDKPRKLKPKELLKAIRRNFISQIERSRMTEEKTTGIEAQYEMMRMENGVEVYAVYTPMANKYLTHTKLWMQGCFSPTWCIASSDANNMWNYYHLYEADYPSVFIVAQKTENGYNPIKYELKCDPYKSSDFKNDEVSLKEWVDEWREPEQNEETYDETSLFDTFNITIEDLEDVIRKLLNSEKSSTFSKKYGKEMLDLYTEKIESGDEDTKMEYLTKACKNGTFINFCDKIDKEDREYFLDELIRYGTLTETEVQKMRIQNNEKALTYLTKMKRCSHKSLEWAKIYFDKNMVRKVYYSLSDEILLSNDASIRESILLSIKNMEDIKENYIDFLISKNEIDNTTLKYVENDEKMFNRCLSSMCKIKKNVNSYTLNYVSRDKDLFLKILKIILENNNIDFNILKFYQVNSNKDILKQVLISLVKNEKVNEEVFNEIIYFKLFYLLEPAIEIATKNDTLNGHFMESFNNIYLDEDKKREDIVNAINRLVEELYDKDKLNWDVLRCIIVGEYYKNIDKTYELILDSYPDKEKFYEDVYDFIETMSKESKMHKKDFTSIITKLVIKHGVYDNHILFFLNEKDAYEILVNLDKEEKLTTEDLIKFILDKSESDLKQNMNTIINLKAFDIKEIIYNLYEYDIDNLNRILKVLLEMGFHFDSEILDTLLEIDYDDDNILQKIVSDNLKINKEEIEDILSNYEREDLLEQ